jgi:para-nitrobenzyl esterase
VSGVIVDTPSGKLQGLEKRGVVQFRGVRYARAERFRPPANVEPWTGVLEATAFGPTAPQNPAPLGGVFGDRPGGGDEDCLFLNVFRPVADAAAPRPVMVWIHGGAFVSGSGSVPWYDGGPLALRGDVIVVTINYRLGALGFLHLGHLDPAFAGSGANGIRDQVAALAWVRDNIAAFGGDPGNVTIFGESAGGMSIGTLLGTPAASGLFHKAIAQSGACAHVHTASAAEWVTEQFLAKLGLSPTALDGVLAAPVDAVLAAQQAVQTDMEERAGRAETAVGAPPVGRLTFQPVIDGTVLPAAPLDAVAAGHAAGVPLVTGTTADEWNLFQLRSRIAGQLTPEQARRRAALVVGDDRADDVLDAYRAARPSADPDGLLCALMTDHVFRIPAIRMAEAHVPHAPRTSMYRFDYASPNFGAVHGIDVPFAFDNLHRAEILLSGLDDGALRLAARTAGAWASVANTGSPEHEDLAWPAYAPDERLTCRLDRQPEVLADPEGEIRRMWDELAPAPIVARP